MWSFLWKPGWILTHLLVLVVVVLMATAGLWQLQRLDERKAYNATVSARQDELAVTVTELLPGGPDATAGQAEAVAFRAVELSGTYRADEQVLVRNRTSDSMPGYWVITPLVLADGDAVAVNRGWVPFATTDVDGGNWADFAPPTGVVQVRGMAREGQVRDDGPVGGPQDAAEGRLATLSRVDLGRLGRQVSAPLYPVYVDLVNQVPAPGQLPVPVPEPELSEGPHLNYAGQWFIFTALTIVVYPLLLRRVARSKAREAAAAASAGGPPVGAAADREPAPSTS